MGVALGGQPTQVGFGFDGVLAARDGLLDGRVQALNADFKLQHTGRKSRNAAFQTLGQLIRHEFKMYEQRLVRLCGEFVEKKFQNLNRCVNFQIEGAVHKLESPRATGIQRRQLT